MRISLVCLPSVEPKTDSGSLSIYREIRRNTEAETNDGGLGNPGTRVWVDYGGEVKCWKQLKGRSSSSNRDGQLGRKEKEESCRGCVPNSARDEERRGWPGCSASQGGRAGWRRLWVWCQERRESQGLACRVHLAAEVPGYCCHSDLYCIKHLIRIIKMQKWPSSMCTNRSFYEKCLLMPIYKVVILSYGSTGFQQLCKAFILTFIKANNTAK